MHDEIDRVFRQLLTAQGLKVRPEQIALSHRMLDAMMNSNIALCDAGTGSGKTFSYLVAALIYLRFCRLCGRYFQPIIISTSSIALQDALRNEYLPLISRAFLRGGLIRAPIQSITRKGKRHYVCQERLERRLRNVNFTKKNREAGNALKALLTELDTNKVNHLSEYDRELVCVPQVCDCKRKYCRYRDFLEDCGSDRFLFHICNHNLLLADAIHRGDGRRPILPDSGTVIIDEAHKLPETARQMFGITLDAGDIQKLIKGLREEQYKLASERLEAMAAPLMRMLSTEPEDGVFEPYVRALIGPDRLLTVIWKQLHNEVTPLTRWRLEHVSSAASVLCAGDPAMIYFAAGNDQGGTTLCATTSNLTGQLHRTLWSQRRPILLTSATLAVGRDFRPFREEAGLLDNERVTESVSPSPFHYQKNCILYLPLSPPRKRGKNMTRYYNALASEILGLLDAAEGHALILCTSYNMMSALKERMTEDSLRWPLFIMGNHPMYTVERFKKCPGSVLLATGPAWEGFDFPGDCVSLLIIPRLPFPIPDAVKEKRKANYPSTQAFIRAVAVPDMQIKLMQGIGRSIRKETDTCVIAILDERATPGQRHYNAIMSVLPKMPRTRSLEDVERFIRRVKPGSYFSEGTQ